jgi:FixJ family two-component response regulator
MNDSSAKSIVFVVDDDPLLLGSVSSLLRSVGLQARVFASTSEFMQEKRPSLPSCLVLDVRLPGVSGLDFQAELSRLNIHIPIIFMTGHGDIPMTVRAMKAGAVEFLTKPFREQDMLDAVKLALERDQSRIERERFFRIEVELRDTDPARAGNHGPGCVRIDEQAGRRQNRAQRDHGKGPSRSHHAKDGSQVAGGSRADG